MSESSRFRSLEGILAKPPAKRPPLQVVDPDGAADPEEATPVSPPQPATPRTGTPAQTPTSTPTPRSSAGAAGSRPQGAARPPKAPTPSQTTGGTRRVAFRLNEELARRLGERVALEGTSQAHVVLDAVETAHQSATLSDLVSAKQRPAPAAGSLFARPTIRRAASASVATEIRLDAGTLAVLDDLVAATGAGTRTQLIVAALTAHLR